MAASLQNQAEIVDILFGDHLGDSDQQAVFEHRIAAGEVITTEDVVFQQVFLELIHRFRTLNDKFMEERPRIQNFVARDLSDLLCRIVRFVVTEASHFPQPFFPQQAE